MKFNYIELIKSNKARIIQVLCVIALAVILLCIGVNQKEVTQEETTAETQAMKELQDVISDIQSHIDKLKENRTEYSNEYTGTIPPFTYTTDIVNIDEDTNSLLGITSNKDTYSGLLRYDFSGTDVKLQDIEIYTTYNIKCKPLIRDTDDGVKVTPYVEAISIEKANEKDKASLDKSKYDLSRYIEFKLKYETKDLEEIVEAGNEAYYCWADSDILDYQNWILALGYTDDMGIVSSVKTIEQLKDEQ